ncbi:MAG: winged helix-turn-helix domain-containing protein [Mesorhizobium sp.]|nr:MAG: winged helix-turn-helix domain-containing protein [Mesorhizobium sp.]
MCKIAADGSSHGTSPTLDLDSIQREGRITELDSVGLSPIPCWTRLGGSVAFAQLRTGNHVALQAPGDLGHGFITRPPAIMFGDQSRLATAQDGSSGQRWHKSERLWRTVGSKGE